MKQLFIIIKVVCILVIGTLAYSQQQTIIPLNIFAMEGRVNFLCYEIFDDSYVVLTPSDAYLPSYYQGSYSNTHKKYGLFHPTIHKKYGLFYATIHTKFKNMVGVVTIRPVIIEGSSWDEMIIPLDRIVEISLEISAYDIIH